MYHPGQRQLQDLFDTRRLADSLEEKLVRATLNPKQKAFIESATCSFSPLPTIRASQAVRIVAAIRIRARDRRRNVGRAELRRQWNVRVVGKTS